MIARARRTNLRWIAPAAAAGLVIATPGLLTSTANAEPVLPPRGAEEVVADVLAAEPVAFMGEVVQRTDLGLPDLPMGAGVDLTNPDSIWSLASGTNTWRLWHDGDDSYRVAIITGQSESDLISNGSVMWAWSSQAQTAVRTELPPERAGDQHLVPMTSPNDAARHALGELEQYSSVTTDSNVRVAGRAAYEVVVTPADPDTRVEQVRIAVDAETSMPLRLQVFATTSTRPVVEIGFTKINYTTPQPSVFEFTPPPGAEVVEGPRWDGSAPTRQLPPEADQGSLPGGTVAPSELPGPATIGEGWSQVTIIPAAHDPASNPLAQALPRVSGDWGSGLVLDGTLISAVFADDGRVAFGAVAPEALYRALGK